MPQIPPYDASLFPLDLNKNPSTLLPTAFPNGLLAAGKLNLRSTYTLSAAQLKALQTTAVQLASAPGVGFTLVPFELILQFKFVTTAYTIGNADNAFQIEYTGKTTNIVKTNATGLVDQASSDFIMVSPAVAGTVFTQANSSNLGLEIKLVGTTPALTLGDGLVNVSLDYCVLPLI